jgi:diacylglycerol kinase
MGLQHSTVKSFSYAFQGVKTAIKNEPNLRIHVFFALSTLIAAAVLKFNVIEWILLMMTIFFVIMLELINTLLESLVNIISPEYNKEAKVAKDVSAAAVLFAAAISVVVGILLFGPKLLQVFN